MQPVHCQRGEREDHAWCCGSNRPPMSLETAPGGKALLHVHYKVKFLLLGRLSVSWIKPSAEHSFDQNVIDVVPSEKFVFAFICWERTLALSTLEAQFRGGVVEQSEIFAARLT